MDLMNVKDACGFKQIKHNINISERPRDTHAFKNQEKRRWQDDEAAFDFVNDYSSSDYDKISDEEFDYM